MSTEMHFLPPGQIPQTRPSTTPETSEESSAMICRSSRVTGRAGRVAAGLVLLASLCTDLMVRAGHVATNLETIDSINVKRTELTAPNSSRIDSEDVNLAEQTETRHGGTADDWTRMKIAVGGVIPILILSTVIILAVYSCRTSRTNPIYKYWERRPNHQILHHNFNRIG